MKVDLAAAYCGVSRSKFLREVEASRMPGGVYDGGNRFWYREDLDSALDQLKGGARPLVDPYMDGLNALVSRETR